MGALVPPQEIHRAKMSVGAWLERCAHYDVVGIAGIDSTVLDRVQVGKAIINDLPHLQHRRGRRAWIVGEECLGDLGIRHAIAAIA